MVKRVQRLATSQHARPPVYVVHDHAAVHQRLKTFAHELETSCDPRPDEAEAIPQLIEEGTEDQSQFHAQADVSDLVTAQLFKSGEPDRVQLCEYGLQDILVALSAALFA